MYDLTSQRVLAGAAGAVSKVYIEDVFSTWLYTGNNSTQTITNGIDLSGKGGLVWLKSRSASGTPNLFDTNRGNTKYLFPYSTAAEGTNTSTRGLTSFNSNGFTLGTDFNETNTSGVATVSWTFRKAAKFFDVVSYTGSGSDQTITHNLGSVPGCIIVKRTDYSGNWIVYHRSLAPATENYLVLNTTDASTPAGVDLWGPPTSTTFKADTFAGLSSSGGTYVAYLFAHDAGGFGDSGNDSVVSCGSYTGNGSTTGPTISLGWEPQWLLIKRTDAAGESWFLVDSMRGLTVAGSDDEYLLANSFNAAFSTSFIAPLATGFQLNSTSGAFNASGGTYIYIAIRRGPMKTPTDATQVFNATSSAAAGGTAITTGFPLDSQIISLRAGIGNKGFWHDRLRGISTTTADSGIYLITNSTAAEASGTQTQNWSNTGFNISGAFGSASTVYWNFRRAPGFFDVVAYTGTGSARTVSHNLGVAPELMIVKRRNSVGNWRVGAVDFSKYSNLQTDGAFTTVSAAFVFGNDSTTISPTSSVFSVGSEGGVNGSGDTYIAYLFASCPGVSKVGSYTGSGTTKQIDCGFTAGARFVLIKRTDSTGDWYVWDSARGIVAGNDPYLLLNSTAAEVTSTDYVDTYSAGFEISSTAPAAINANGGSFVFLAVA